MHPVVIARAVSLRPRARTHRLGGFTLIENLVALAIFMVGIMAVTYLLADSVTLAKTGQGQTAAYLAAQEVIGMLRASGANALSYNGVTVSSVNPPSSDGATVFQSNLSTWWQALLHLPGAAGPPTIAATGKPRVAGALQVLATNGNGQCPCSATITESWGQNTYVVSTEIVY